MREHTCDRVTEEAITHSPDLLIRPACVRLKAARTSSGIQSAASTSKRSSALVLTLLTATEKSTQRKAQTSSSIGDSIRRIYYIRIRIVFSGIQHTILPAGASTSRKLRVDAVAWNDERRWQVGPTLRVDEAQNVD